MTTDPELACVASAPSSDWPTPEERLRQRVNMLTQLLVVAAVVVALEFGIMLKLLMETSR